VGLWASTIFLSAFLLFQVQPLVGKYLLPWFGGGPGVWTACLLFFQTVLLAGYAYAHLIRTYLPRRGQVLVHLAVLVVAAVLLPIAPSAAWKPEAAVGDPTGRILLLLATSVGLPYFALAATSPLVQAWFGARHPGRSPYRLYALSNAGSLGALVTYPFLVEPALRLGTQATVWSAGFVGFAALCAGCGVALWRAKVAAETPAARPAHGGGVAEAAPGVRGWLLWLALPACGSVMLLAVTNQMCADVAVVPFLWILPLGLYLLSFVLCFRSDRAYPRPLFWVLLPLAAAVILWLLYENIQASILWQIVGYSAGLFVVCMVCHGELARLKPGPRRLTSFYLAIAAGGAMGGLLVALVAPRIFRGYFELHVGLWACLVLAMLAVRWDRGRRPAWWPQGSRLFWFGGAAVLAAVTLSLGVQVYADLAGAVEVSRNFYGVLRVEEGEGGTPGGRLRLLRHGRILHGTQFMAGPWYDRPTLYYGERTGVGLAIGRHRRDAPRRVGVVGLGVGTLAAYGRPGDVYRFYEINPDVERLARTRFTFLADSSARCEVVPGDARLSLQREPPQAFDVLVLDAFTGDAVPVHLLTEQAFAIYLGHLADGGVLAVHVSNRYLNLGPVVLAAADRFGLSRATVVTDDRAGPSAADATWILLARDPKVLEDETIRAAALPAEPTARRLWTDDYADLFHVLRWKRPDGPPAADPR